ncbi:MAG: aminotransferase class I/II-fold pyridoxal phosphate-dependent enzyme [Candidatus Pacebacteria bacterium]|nr:aminotransferase class I/II-fold pyridoxal phosphate-dependent enzyme [Candidatus Paceibacterota bacterium]
MLRKISLKMNVFIPSDDNQPVLDLSAGVSGRLNRKTDGFLNRLGKFKLRELAGSADRGLEEKLKVEIRKFLRVSRIVKNNNIVFGFGSYSVLERLAWKLLPKGLIAGEFPQFRFFPMEYILAGGSYQGLWSKNFVFPVEQILKAIAEEKNLKVIYINNPNNPTGQVCENEDLIRIIKKASGRKIFVIIDEVYADLLASEKTMAGLVNKFDNLIVVRSFSKIFGLSNIRVGYMITGQKIMRAYQNVCNWNEITNCGAIMATEILRDKDYFGKLKKDCFEFKKETINILAKFGFETVPTDPYVPIIFFRTKKKQDICEYFRSKNIRVDSGKSYQFLGNPCFKDYARIRVPSSKKDLLTFKERLC